MSKTSVAVAAPAPADEGSSERKAPQVSPKEITVDSHGQAVRRLVIRLPAGFIADDLKSPEVWRTVQATAYALKRHDHLYLKSFDESWVAECICVEGTNQMAELSKPRITQMESRLKDYFNDGKYRIAWIGNGYAVFRLSDNSRMTAPTANEQLAMADLRGLYPRPVNY